VRIEKVFAKRGSDGARQVIDSFAPYFCDECVATCAKERTSDPWLPIRRILHGWVLWFPILGSFIAGAWVLGQSFPGQVQLGLVAFFWGITAWCCYSIWRQTRHLAVQPPNSVTSAVDFTRNQSDWFEPPWRKFTFRNPEYAEHFRNTNRSRLWSSRHPSANRAAMLRYFSFWILAAAFGVAAVFAVAGEFDIPLWQYIRRVFP
jgi:hypothetical protein